MSAPAVITKKTIIDDYTARQLYKMGEKFFSDSENVRKYTEWHLKEYGYLPDGQTQTIGGNKNA